MLATYHNHSTWSDGTDTPEQLVDAAATLGIDELGLSDHYVLHPTGHPPPWAMAPNAIVRYIGQLASLRERTITRGSDLQLRIGLEVDWFPGQRDALRDALEPLPLDFVLGSVHEVDGFNIDGSPHRWEKLSQDERDQVHRSYWNHMRELAQSGLFDIVAHIDLPKKFAYLPTIDLSDEIDAALDAIAAQDGLVVEINTAGWHKPCADAYPSADIVHKCWLRGIPMTINADAHQAQHLLRDFDKAVERMRDAGYTQVARFANRTIHMEPLEHALPMT